MTFSIDEDRWPYIAVLAWIVSRSEAYTAHLAQYPLAQADGWRAHHNAYVRTGLMRDSLANAKGELSDALAVGKLTGSATKLSRAYKRHTRFNFTLEAEAAETGCAFPPPKELAILSNLRDADDRAGDALLFQRVDGDAKEFTVTDWRDLTFARDDILRLWREHPRAAAYREARTSPWREPPQIDKASLGRLNGVKPSLDAILDALAPGDELAERFRAVHWLCEHARDGRVTIYGRPARPRIHPANPIEGAGPSAAIDPSDFNDDALTLAACDPPAAHALGVSDYAARFAECANAADAVKWCNVAVDREELEVNLRKFSPAGESARKRAAVKQAFTAIGFAALENMGQKNREPAVIECVAKQNISVSDRFVRNRWSEWKKEQSLVPKRS